MKQIVNSAPTIFDVARLAGVSRGTVDRVVYGRGRVSSETKERVRLQTFLVKMLKLLHVTKVAIMQDIQLHLTEKHINYA